MSTLRMEPQFMIMGQSAGVVASLALRAANRSVHDVDTALLHAELLAGVPRASCALRVASSTRILG